MRHCMLCGKTSMMGGTRIKLRGKYNPTNWTRKYPNLQKTTTPKGQKVLACTQCIRTFSKPARMQKKAAMKAELKKAAEEKAVIAAAAPKPAAPKKEAKKPAAKKPKIKNPKNPSKTDILVMYAWPRTKSRAAYRGVV